MQTDIPTCVTLFSLLHYFQLTNFFWMFVEGELQFCKCDRLIIQYIYTYNICDVSISYKIYDIVTLDNYKGRSYERRSFKSVACVSKNKS